MSQETLLLLLLLCASTCKLYREGGPYTGVPYGVTSDVIGVTAALRVPLYGRCVCLLYGERERERNTNYTLATDPEQAHG